MGDAFQRLAGNNWLSQASGHPRYKNRVIVLGLPPAITYQNVLELAVEAGHSVVFIDIATSRVCGFVYGVIEYASYEDYKFCIDYLDGKQMQFDNAIGVKTLRFVKAEKLAQIEKHVQKKQVAQPKPVYPPTMPTQQQQQQPPTQQPMAHPMPPSQQQPMHPYQNPMHAQPYPQVHPQQPLPPSQYYPNAPPQGYRPPPPTNYVPQPGPP